MARTTHFTVSYKATVRMAKFEPVEVFHSETVELEEGDSPGRVREALRQRVHDYVENAVLDLRAGAAPNERRESQEAGGGFAFEGRGGQQASPAPETQRGRRRT